MSILTDRSTDLAPAAYLSGAGRILAWFDERTQDSGNVSWSIESAGERFFVKTAGALEADAFLSHAERVSWLRNAVRLSRHLPHAAVPALRNVIESSHGPMLVYDWVPGDLLHVPASLRGDPGAPFVRFKALPLSALVAALDRVFLFHRDLCSTGWVASDFYDGAIIYDFETADLKLVDLDMYREGPFVNDMGRMFGSTRFMAPEEFERGAEVDERTTVFNMGRCIEVFAGGREVARDLAAVAGKACMRQPGDRFATMNDFYGAWSETAKRVVP